MNKANTETKAFILLLAGMMSLVALSVDAMLPALVTIANDFDLAQTAQAQWTITSLFIGLSIGQLIYGPWSDAVGRKPPIYWGYSLFIVGTLICVFSESFSWLIAGRVLQGMGAAAPRIITMALVRDKLKGAEMARIMSVVFSVFIVVPILAPAIGQLIISVAHWRWIFGMLLIMAVSTGFWFWRYQEETLQEEQRRPLTVKSFIEGLRFLLAEKAALVYTVISGLVFGSFLGYLNSAPLVFIELYDQQDNFALLFAAAACAVGVASLVNGRMVLKMGMRKMIIYALLGLVVLTSLFCVVLLASNGVPHLLMLMLYLVPAFFCIGILFGNLNSLAMEPLGAIAGMGSAFVACLSTLIAIPIGSLIGLSFNGTCYPIVLGFLFVGLSSLTLIKIFDPLAQTKA
ncbi:MULTISPECIES: multidrug effflux MFS transporter [unclassified Agarivorans]|uniref:multidrug effflux MFS transporter n=1 Tax=unclassified Agarivorans TaxID=2636026 RepID=UPI0026E25245|nr:MULTISPECIES: multidrug effflux MFS transporter [unclassified Agarivorans]MDO6684224.1 multidrug effflux MFS transporter [Agarivorans sp. 3_MG-2023]MDO6714042.1 multidrug effflux MFS transporter [Agarivorans sp. 2_MG-2023]